MKRFTVTVGDKTTRLAMPDMVEDEYSMDLRPVTEKDALTRGVEKMYGKTCFWWEDSGLGWHYGQVMCPVPQKLGGGNSAVTYRVSADVVEGWD